VAKDRIVLLDSLRGLAILAILLCNIPVAAMPERVAESVPLWPLGQNPATLTVWYVTQALFQQKFYTLFSMLFGASILLVAGEGPLLNMTLIKRLVSLLVIGLLHGFLLWQGDVLSFYALVGLVAMLARGWSARRLLTVGVAIHVGGYAWRGFKILQNAPKGMLPIPPDLKAKIATEAQAQIGRFSGDFVSSLLANAHGYKEFFVGSWTEWPQIWPLMVLGLMLIGMGLFKLGVLKRRGLDPNLSGPGRRRLGRDDGGRLRAGPLPGHGGQGRLAGRLGPHAPGLHRPGRHPGLSGPAGPGRAIAILEGDPGDPGPGRPDGLHQLPDAVTDHDRDLLWRPRARAVRRVGPSGPGGDRRGDVGRATAVVALVDGALHHGSARMGVAAGLSRTDTVAARNQTDP
jgi:hypothetical protein